MLSFFKNRVIVHPRTRCWIWTMSHGTTGYGQINICKGDKKYPERAHRFSYEKHVGPIPDGLCVLHKCDVRSCINPDHLFLGTKRDNILDCYAKGRRPKLPALRGESNPMHKLTDQQVREIRASGDTQTSLAARYGVSQARISKIKRREAWL